MNEQESPALEVCLRLARAEAVLMRRFDMVLGNLHGISFADFQLLATLGRAPGMRLRRVDLAERLALTASGVTRSLLALEKIGLVERQSDPRDARVGYAVLAPSGQTLLANASVSAGQLADELFRDVNAESTSQLSAILGKLAGFHSDLL